MSRNTSGRGRSDGVKVVLAIGFLALAAGVLWADASQPRGYELSIYSGTPMEFWAGIGVALAVSLGVSFTAGRARIRRAGLVLGGMAVAAIVGLPVLRGYYFNGTADALTHLGWARDMATGAMAPAELFYPGIHSVSVVFSSLAGIEITRAILFTVATMVVLALVFVPLVVRTVSREHFAVIVGGFSVFLLFMVHNLGVFLHAHSFAQATFFSSLVFFLAFAYLARRRSKVAIGGLLAVAAIAVVLYHPQQAANLIVVFVAVSLLQFLHRRFAAGHPIASHRRLYAHTGLLIVAFVAWITRFEGWAFFNFGRAVDAFSAYLSGTPPTAGGMARSQSASLAAIGSGLPEMFVKLFLVAAVFTALSGVLMIASALRVADESRPTANAIATYLLFGSLGVVLLVGVYFFGNIAEHYFRHIGFLFLIATIVGALALTRGIAAISSRWGPRATSVVVVVLFGIMLPLSLASVYPSPFIHKQTQHVSEPQMEGHQAIFEVKDETLPLGGIRRGPWRYSDAIHGVAASADYDTTVLNEDLRRLVAHYEVGGYLVVSENDRAREVGAYEELRYTDRAFRSLDAQPGVNRVATNDAVRLFHVPGDGG
jgi:hypothetical protein